MARGEGGRDDAELEQSSEESRFSDAAPKSFLEQPKRKRKRDKKRMVKVTSVDSDFVEEEFTFSERLSDMDRTDGGALGAGLQSTLNSMASPGGGRGPTTKKKQSRKQGGGGQTRRSGGQVGAGGPRSTTVGRAQRQGGGYRSLDAFLEQAVEQQRADVIGAGHLSHEEPRHSLTTSPKLRTSDRLASGRDAENASKTRCGTGEWVSTYNNDEAKLTVGPLGKITKLPSTTTKRSKEKRALNQSRPAGNRQCDEAQDLIDMTSDDNGAREVKRGSFRRRTPPPVPRTAESDDQYGIADTFSSGGGRKTSGVDWDLESNKSSDMEDFVEGPRRNERPNGKRERKSQASNRKSRSDTIHIEDNDENPGVFQSSVISQAKGAIASVANKLFRGSKRGKDEQGGSGDKKGTSISPGCTFPGHKEQEDDILSFNDSADEGRGRETQNVSGVQSEGKNGGKSKSKGIAPDSFHAKKLKSNFQPLASQILSAGKRKKAPLHGEIGSISPKRRHRRSKRKRKNEVITIDDDSSDNDSAQSEGQFLDDLEKAKQKSLSEISSKPRAVGGRLIIDAARVAIGKKVFSHQCKFQIQLGTSNPFLRISYLRDASKRNTVHTIYDESIEELRYFLAEQDEESDGEESLRQTVSSGGDGLSFLAMRIAPTKDNGLESFSSAYLQSIDENDNDKKYIVVELRSDDEFVVALDEKLRAHAVFGGYFSEQSRLGRDQAKYYSSALIEDDRKDKQKRVSMPGKRNTRSSTRASKAKSDSEGHKIHLVYPFDAEEDFLENACKDLHELGGKFPVASNDGAGLNWVGPASRNEENSSSDSSTFAAAASASDDNDEGLSTSAAFAPSKASTRTHYLTIRQDEIERLEPGEFLNDTLIDFFMRWIWRDDGSPEMSSVHFFTSHFFTTLDDEGPEAVSSWTAKKNIDIFKKRFIFIPINESLHWSLCVVVNPGFIDNEFKEGDDQSEDQDFPFILFLDSLKAHRKNKVANKVRKWLNHEAKRLRKFADLFGDETPPFNKNTMEVFDPKVPYQDNSWDCGVFVCRYAYALYLMRNKRVTYRTAGVEDQPPFLRDLITNSPEFNFNMNDIGRVREELKKLIQNLSSGYLEAKAKEDAEQDEKRRAKKRKLQTEAAAAKASADAKDDEETKGGEEKKSDEFIDEANDGRVDKDVDGAEV